MKIEMNQQEYELLLDMVYIADYVFHTYLGEEDPGTEKYRVFEQKIMSWAKDFELENLVDWDKEYNQFLPSDDFFERSESPDYIENFEVNSFWEELIDRLAVRDIFMKYGEKDVKKMSDKEFLLKRNEFRRKYEKEFESNGLQNIQITVNSGEK